MTVQIRALYDWFNGIGALAVPGEETAGAVVRALDELLAYREGYDPAEREPDLGQWAVIEPVDVRDGEPPMLIMQWVNTPEDVRWFIEDMGDSEEAQVWYVKLGFEWMHYTKSEVRRWWPLPGGEG